MKLLFIKLKLIGDALILTGTLREVKRLYPDAEIHVVVRKGTEGILAGCPEISAIHTTGDKSGGKTARLRRELGLIRRLRREKFDRAFELGDGDRGRTLALLSGAKHRHANFSRIDSGFWRRVFRGSPVVSHDGKHASEWDSGVVAAALGVSLGKPQPVFVRERADFGPVDGLGFSAAPVIIHPVASREGKMWTKENWVAVVRLLAARKIPVLLSCGPAPAERALCDAIAAESGAGEIFKTDGRYTWSQVAGACYRSRLYLGLDTAAMHLAAACGTPVVALFAQPPESYPGTWAPVGTRCTVLESKTSDPSPKAVGVDEVVAVLARENIGFVV